jgi:ATP-dependent DNA helicase RecG
VHPLAEQPTTDVATDVTMDVEDLLQVMQNDMLRSALQTAIGLRNAEHFSKAYLMPAIAAGYLETTLSDTPRCTSQGYRLPPIDLQRQRELKGNRA